jgi:hypothetical protein
LTRHEHGNSWSDTQADDARAALVHTLEGSTSRMELVDPADSGWSVWWQEERIVSSVNKAIRAALKTDSFAAYLKHKRGWTIQATSNFSLDRWASKLTKRGQIDLSKLREDEILALGICRLCGRGPETNWHVQAECTHQGVVAERRATSLSIIDTILSLDLPASATQLLTTNWLLDSEGRAHDLNDLDKLSQVLKDWAPDIAATAQSIQDSLLWSTEQGPNRDNLRKWAFRGLMLDHWKTLLGTMGVPAASAVAALDKIETAVYQSVPAI